MRHKPQCESTEAIDRIRQTLPEMHVVLGISNVGFGLSPTARMALDSVFLNDCCSVELDAAIVSPAKILPLNRIKPEQQQMCRNLIHDRRRFDGDVCICDLLTALTEVFAGVSGQTAKATGPRLADLPVEEPLKQHTIDEEHLNLEESLELALQETSTLEIVNCFLLEKTEGGKQDQDKVLITIVKKDVHDIGKNLVDIILTNNDYEVINLDIKQDVTAIINAQK